MLDNIIIVYYYHNILIIGIIILRFLLNVQNYKIDIFYQACVCYIIS